MVELFYVNKKNKKYLTKYILYLKNKQKKIIQRKSEKNE